MNNLPNNSTRAPITTMLKLEDTPERVELTARILRERFTVVSESPDRRMHGALDHLVRRWVTIVLVDENGEIAPCP